MSETRTQSVSVAASVFVDALQNIADGVTELAGFEVAAISVARGDGTLEMIAVAGSSEAREQLMHHRTPISEIEQELKQAEHWGDLRFVPHERMTVAEDQLGWVPDLPVSQDPDAWHPLDLLMAPIYDDSGGLRGLMSVDVPVDLRRPDAERRLRLQRYAHQTRRAVLTALERAELAEQVRLANAARSIVRQVTSELSLERIIEVAQPALTAGFSATGLWIQTFDADHEQLGNFYTPSGTDIVLPDEMRRISRNAAHYLWQRQEVGVVARGLISTGISSGDLSRHDEARILEAMDAIDVTSMLFVPLGAGPECLGNLALTRRGGDLDWNSVERQAALDIGHDLGRALLNARLFERERKLVEELRALDSYKSRLIATLAHELKNPLSSVLGHVEMLEAIPDLTGATLNSVGAIERGAVRMQRLIDDLLVLGRVADPHKPFVAFPIDVVKVIEESLDLLRVSFERKSLKVIFNRPEHPVLALGDAAGLDLVFGNLISNAVKYTPEGGTITIDARDRVRRVEVRVADTGLGISEADRALLFEEFFRSNNPAAVAQPGTGLGLVIVKRVLERHGGTITVESELGEGAAFTVNLPRAI